MKKNHIGVSLIPPKFFQLLKLRFSTQVAFNALRFIKGTTYLTYKRNLGNAYPSLLTSPNLVQFGPDNFEN